MTANVANGPLLLVRTFTAHDHVRVLISTPTWDPNMAVLLALLAYLSDYSLTYNTCRVPRCPAIYGYLPYSQLSNQHMSVGPRPRMGKSEHSRTNPTATALGLSKQAWMDGWYATKYASWLGRLRDKRSTRLLGQLSGRAVQRSADTLVLLFASVSPRRCCTHTQVRRICMQYVFVCGFVCT